MGNIFIIQMPENVISLKMQFWFKTNLIPKMSEMDKNWNLKTDNSHNQRLIAETTIYILMAKK